MTRAETVGPADHGGRVGVRVALLIDADNVSADVVEQAVARLLDEHGALHVRRAYGTAENAVKQQSLFKRLSIRPMVNLSTGKNATDIALAVDAIDLVIGERPDVVAIASSDSDFEPLVARLREKGCRVIGFGQAGKTGDETRALYDAYTVLEHRKGATATRAAARKTVPAAPAAAPRAARPAAKAPAEAARAPAPAPGPAAGAAAAKSRRRRSTSGTTAAPQVAAAAAEAVAADLAAEAAPRAPAAPAAPVAPPPQEADKLARILAALPELGRGDTVELRLAAERLREAGLIGRSGSSTRVFGAYPQRFELLPEKNPNKVRLRG